MQEEYTMACDCSARESQMSEWESDFIESITDRLEEGKSLTRKQAEILDRIWEKVTASG